MRRLFYTLFFILFAVTTFAQVTTVSSDTLRKDAIRVYMDANDYLKREIPFINYVRDIKDAQVYILDAFEQAGSGGWKYTYFLVGQNNFAGMNDTVSIVTSPDDTQDQSRKKQASILKMALMRYVARTPLSAYIDINFTKPISEEVTIDKWNNWVFKTRLTGRLNEQATSSSADYNGSFSASRITNNWKLIFDLSYNESKDVFKIGDAEIKSINSVKSFESTVARSLSDHWSFGGTTEFTSSTFKNYDINFEIMPSIEYDIFPYTESTRRLLRFMYSAGFVYNDYADTTVYLKVNESLWAQKLISTYSVVQKWGSINIGLEWSNYFHDWALNNLSLSGNMEFRITRGLSLTIGGGASLIHDQINLALSGATEEEILTKQKELETNYSYYTNFGITYTFGSIYNNVVNPRFSKNRRGGSMMFF